MNEHLHPAQDDRLSAYLDGELSLEERKAVEKLLEERQDYQAMFRSMQAARAALRKLPIQPVRHQWSQRMERALVDGVSDSETDGDPPILPRPIVIKGPRSRWPRWHWIGISLGTALLLLLWVKSSTQEPNRTLAKNDSLSKSKDEVLGPVPEMLDEDSSPVRESVDALKTDRLEIPSGQSSPLKKESLRFIPGSPAPANGPSESRGRINAIANSSPASPEVGGAPSPQSFGRAEPLMDSEEAKDAAETARIETPQRPQNPTLLQDFKQLALSSRLEITIRDRETWERMLALVQHFPEADGIVEAGDQYHTTQDEIPTDLSVEVTGDPEALKKWIADIQSDESLLGKMQEESYDLLLTNDNERSDKGIEHGKEPLRFRRIAPDDLRLQSSVMLDMSDEPAARGGGVPAESRVVSVLVKLRFEESKPK